MGIDLGTSSVKTLIMDPSGQLKALSQRDYAFDIPQPGWAEQDPETWWLAAAQTIREALEQANISPQDLAGIGFSGQMHGLITLDRQGTPLRPAIIWCDQRTAGEIRSIEQQIGLKQLGTWTCNRVAAGFQTASLLWLKTHEPQIYDATSVVLTPKDYLRFRLTGECSTDITDAAGTLALDVREGRWSSELLAALALRSDYYPPINLPESLAGQVSPVAAAQTGLAPGTAVFHGGADQVMQAIGNGIILPGQVSATIGTGGQIFAPLAEAWYDPELRTHTFSNYDGRSWYLMGASLSAGLALRWLRGQVLNGLPYREMDRLAAAIPVSSDGLFFLPYLTGERTPHMDPEARAMFAGLTLRHGQGHLIRSVLEGVAYALRDSLEILRQLGQPADQIIASGGGAQSPLWLQIQADVFQTEIKISQMSEQAAVGAAIVAGVGAGLYPDYVTACQAVVRWHDIRYEPEPAASAIYDQGHRIFQALYPANRSIMAEMGRL
jgi:xylulokinase